MKKYNILFFTIFFAGVCSILPAQENTPVRLLISGGDDGVHPYGQCSGVLIDALRKSGGIICTYSEDPAVLKIGYLKNYDVVMLYNGMFYDNSGGKKNIQTPGYIPAGLEQFVQDGGGLLVIHSAIVSYTDWQEYINLIGGIWDWKKSAHDAYGKLKSDVAAEHPIVKDLPKSFEFQDEFYHTMTVQPGVKVLVEATHQKGGKTVTEPLVWVQKDSPKERVAVIMQGHDMGSWGNENMQKMLTNAIRWAAKK